MSRCNMLLLACVALAVTVPLVSTRDLLTICPPDNTCHSPQDCAGCSGKTSCEHGMCVAPPTCPAECKGNDDCKSCPEKKTYCGVKTHTCVDKKAAAKEDKAEEQKMKAAKEACNNLITANGNTNNVGTGGAATGGTASGQNNDASAIGGDGTVDGVTIVGNNLAICRISLLNGNTVEKQVEIPGY